MYTINSTLHRIQADLVDINYNIPSGYFSFVFKASDFEWTHSFEISSSIEGVKNEYSQVRMLEWLWIRYENYKNNYTLTLSSFENLVSKLEEEYKNGKFDK
jgi:hypothetical protein